VVIAHRSSAVLILPGGVAQEGVWHVGSRDTTAIVYDSDEFTSAATYLYLDVA